MDSAVQMISGRMTSFKVRVFSDAAGEFRSVLQLRFANGNFLDREISFDVVFEDSVNVVKGFQQPTIIPEGCIGELCVTLENCYDVELPLAVSLRSRYPHLTLSGGEVFQKLILPSKASGSLEILCKNAGVKEEALARGELHVQVGELSERKVVQALLVPGWTQFQLAGPKLLSLSHNEERREVAVKNVSAYPLVISGVKCSSQQFFVEFSKSAVIQPEATANFTAVSKDCKSGEAIVQVFGHPVGCLETYSKSLFKVHLQKTKPPDVLRTNCVVLTFGDAVVATPQEKSVTIAKKSGTTDVTKIRVENGEHFRLVDRKPPFPTFVEQTVKIPCDTKYQAFVRFQPTVKTLGVVQDRLILNQGSSKYAVNLYGIGRNFLLKYSVRNPAHEPFDSNVAVDFHNSGKTSAFCHALIYSGDFNSLTKDVYLDDDSKSSMTKMLTIKPSEFLVEPQSSVVVVVSAKTPEFRRVFENAVLVVVSGEEIARREYQETSGTSTLEFKAAKNISPSSILDGLNILGGLQPQRNSSKKSLPSKVAYELLQESLVLSKICLFDEAPILKTLQNLEDTLAVDF